MHSGVILFEIYSKFFTKIDSLFWAGACMYLMFFDILAYLYGLMSRERVVKATSWVTARGVSVSIPNN